MPSYEQILGLTEYMKNNMEPLVNERILWFMNLVVNPS